MSTAPQPFRPGDILAFSGRGGVSRAIKLGGCSRFSHIGGIAHVCRSQLSQWATCAVTATVAARVCCWDDRPLLFESTTWSETPCVITGECIQGVQAHDPEGRIEAYPGQVWRMRLAPPWRLDRAESRRLTEHLLCYLGTPYDQSGAMLSGSRLLVHLLVCQWLFGPQDVSAMFCSEMWADALKKAGRFPPVNASRITPARLIRTLMDVGYYLPPERIK